MLFALILAVVGLPTRFMAEAIQVPSAEGRQEISETIPAEEDAVEGDSIEGLDINVESGASSEEESEEKLITTQAERPTVLARGYQGTYDGSPHGASVSVSGGRVFYRTEEPYTLDLEFILQSKSLIMRYSGRGSYVSNRVGMSGGKITTTQIAGYGAGSEVAEYEVVRRGIIGVDTSALNAAGKVSISA